MSLVTARPAELSAYAQVASEVVADLDDRTAELRGTLDDLRSSPDWHEFVSDIPPLDVDLAVCTAHVERLGAFCARVARLFGAVDEDGIATALAASVQRRAGTVHPAGVDLIRHGDRWIVNGTDGHDHVQLIERDGQLVLIVGTFDRARGEIVYQDEVVLTAQQADGLVIRTGGGNDVVEVSPDVRVRLTVWTGDGDDLVGWTDDTGVPRVGGGGDVDIFLGEGDDIAVGGAGNDRIYGGGGRDVIDGGAGRDLLVGGDGNDTLYGGRGDDGLHGGRGDDYLEGGSGDDVLRGGDGDDVLSGGRGDDVLSGGRGDDVLTGGRGSDRVDGGGGSDTVHSSGDDRIRNAERTVTIAVEGEPGSTAIVLDQPSWMSDEAYDAWLERIDSDLELLRHTPSGNEGLAALDAASDASESGILWWRDRDRVLVVPYGADRGAEEYAIRDWMEGRRLPGSYAGPPGFDGDDAVVNYGTLHPRALDERPPVVSLYHELAHTFDQISGGTQGGEYEEVLVDADGEELRRRTAPMAEINSVGHDLDGDGDIDTQPTGDGTAHPAALTENRLREDLGRPRRPSYTIPPEDIPDGGEVRIEGVDP